MKWSLRQSFRFAWDGFLFTVVSQRNFRIHLVISLSVVLLGLIFRLSLVRMAVLILTIALVLLAEMINTAIEVTNDVLAGQNYHPRIKVAKDVAAGAVLVTAVSAVLIGILLFLEPALGLLQVVLSQGISPVRTELTLLLAVLFCSTALLVFILRVS